MIGKRVFGLLFVWLIFALLFGCNSETEKNLFLHTQGQDMIDSTGSKVLLRGVGLGNWLLPEGYMWKFGDGGDRPRKIEKIVTDLIGEENAEQFWLEFRQNYITESDVKRIAELGFNSVRPALNARRFLTEGADAVYVEEGFQLLDNLVAWCKKYGLYVIIDMHGAPGGQTGANIDDSPNDEPELFMDPVNQDRLVDLWVKIAERYKDEPAVAAYDLLNEPLPQRTGAAEKYGHLVEPLYKRITAAIREVDPNHMITLEGVDWSNDWSVFGPPFDDNVFYQFHYYCWDRPDVLKSVQTYIDRREELNTPIWVGETGEKQNTIYWGTTQYFEKNNIGWSFWPWKKMDTPNTPYSINRPEGWDEIVAYSRGEGKPSQEVAQRAFDQLLENIKLENCVYFPDVVNAIFRRVPGKVEAENYGHEGFNNAYFVSDTTTKSEHYRKDEFVPVELIDFDESQWFSQQAIRLGESEWTQYRFNSLASRDYKVTASVKADAGPAEFEFGLNDQTVKMSVSERGWQQVDLGNISAKSGANDCKLLVTNGRVAFDWIHFE